jgi:type IV pilus assembly protein PilA
MKALGSKGFTLIELLVVVAIIGILAAIAIPQFSLYRAKGYDARAESDVRNGATAEEANYATYGSYVGLTVVTGPVKPTTLPGFTVSATVSTAFVDKTTYFTGTATSSAGTNITCNWDSNGGGFTGCS